MNFLVRSVLFLRPYRKDWSIALKVLKLSKVESSLMEGKIGALEMILLDRQVTNILSFCFSYFGF